MTHTLTHSDDDFITFQLYEASTNLQKKKNRKKSYFTLIGLGILMTILGYVNKSTFFMYYGFFCTCVAIVFGNMYLKWHHKRHYTKHVKNVRKNAIVEPVQIEIGEQLIQMSERIGESSIKISEIIAIAETKDHYFIKVSTGHSLIIPKTVPALNEEIVAMIKNHHISLINALDWEWK